MAEGQRSADALRPVDIQVMPACQRAFPGARVLQLRSAQVLGTRHSRLGLASIATRPWMCQKINSIRSASRLCGTGLRRPGRSGRWR
ncbi:MAG: hypothetical protein EOQ64_03885 [Mesorhizobium sp.]|nr:MAG: hypothetical protein EOQ64_03885 [Mesorhizobium sp.]RWH32031.1 MAG: hypothetical protein EOQ76_04785 [Mesorhizobium sp.]RWH36080.1 MAG: hypothetical protein EOQ79_19260 [Mesorhizobium sp.]RWH46364.1 MAG: hypothetical protein EOQ78_03530 [Mesorhizobium sp.]RWI25926.1 MAG: hypothetical protein EOQ94_10115 [Mesorhizobium sp.]